MESIFNSCLSEYKFVAYLDENYCRLNADAIIIFANPSKVCCLLQDITNDSNWRLPYENDVWNGLLLVCGVGKWVDSGHERGWICHEEK